MNIVGKRNFIFEVKGTLFCEENDVWFFEKQGMSFCFCFRRKTNGGGKNDIWFLVKLGMLIFFCFWRKTKSDFQRKNDPVLLSYYVHQMNIVTCDGRPEWLITICTSSDHFCVNGAKITHRYRPCTKYRISGNTTSNPTSCSECRANRSICLSLTPPPHSVVVAQSLIQDNAVTISGAYNGNVVPLRRSSWCRTKSAGSHGCMDLCTVYIIINTLILLYIVSRACKSCSVVRRKFNVLNMRQCACGMILWSMIRRIGRVLHVITYR